MTPVLSRHGRRAVSGNRVHGLGVPLVAKWHSERWRWQTESCALRMLAGTSLAPSLVMATVVRGRPLTVMTRVNGGQLEGGEKGLAEALKLLRRLHRTPLGVRTVGRLSDAPEAQGWADYLRTRLASYGAELRRRQLPEATRGCAQLSAQLHAPPSAPVTLLHNDPNPGNFLRSRTGPRLIDWELALVGDPLLDLVRCCWEWQLPSESWAEALGYSHDHPTVRAYRAVHCLSRLMAATASPPSTASTALATRCREDLEALGLWLAAPRRARHPDRSFPPTERDTTPAPGPPILLEPSVPDRPHLLDLLLSDALPGTRMLDAPVPTTKGLFNEGWRVRTDRGELLVKLHQDPDIAQKHFVGARDASARARERGVAVPEVLAAGVSGGGLPGDGERSGSPHWTSPIYAYLVQEWLAGQDAEDYLVGASTSEGIDFFTDFGSLTAALHNVPYDYGLAEEQRHDAHALTRAKLTSLVERNEQCGVLSADELSRASRVGAELLEQLTGRVAPRMTHYDLHLPNVLVRPDGSLALIDLDFARPGDPLQDLVKPELWAFDGPGRQEAFLAGYRAARDERWPADAGRRLLVHRLLNSLSYVAFFSTRDPEQVGEWTERLGALCDEAETTLAREVPA